MSDCCDFCFLCCSCFSICGSSLNNSACWYMPTSWQCAKCCPCSKTKKQFDEDEQWTRQITLEHQHHKQTSFGSTSSYSYSEKSPDVPTRTYQPEPRQSMQYPIPTRSTMAPPAVLLSGGHHQHSRSMSGAGSPASFFGGVGVGHQHSASVSSTQSFAGPSPGLDGGRLSRTSSPQPARRKSTMNGFEIPDALHPGDSRPSSRAGSPAPMPSRRKSTMNGFEIPDTLHPGGDSSVPSSWSSTPQPMDRPSSRARSPQPMPTRRKSTMNGYEIPDNLHPGENKSRPSSRSSSPQPPHARRKSTLQGHEIPDALYPGGSLPTGPPPDVAAAKDLSDPYLNRVYVDGRSKTRPPSTAFGVAY